MATWHAIYDQTTGTLLSLGSVLAEALPPNVAVKDYPSRPDQGMIWEPASLDFIPIPTPVLIDRLQDLLSDPDYADFATVYANLSAARKTLIRNVLIKLMGGRRFRDSNEPPAIDPTPVGN